MDRNEAEIVAMRRALAEAERGRGSVEPNPVVGAVVLRDDRTVAVGHHGRFGGPHAEVVALAAAGDAAQGSTLVVTLEPCRHHGKTPPCTEAILAAGVARVVAAMSDPFPAVAGGGFARLREAGLQVDVGLLEAEARRLNAPFLKRVATGMPYVIAKWAMTLDGRTATKSGDSRWISSPRSRAMVHELRGRMDAILVGIGTALADDPALTARPPGPRTPARVVVDSAGRLPLDGTLARSAREVPVIVAVTDRAAPERRGALADRGCEILAFAGAGRVPILALLQELGRRGMTNVLLEGGGTLAGAFFEVDAIDEVDVYVAPRLAGGPPGRSPVSGHGVERMDDAMQLIDVRYQEIDGDIRMRGRVPRPWLVAESA